MEKGKEKIYTGPKGGKYKFVKGKKVYIKSSLKKEKDKLSLCKISEVYLIYLNEKDGIYHHIIGIYDSYEKAKKLVDSKKFQEEYEAPFLSPKDLQKEKPPRYSTISLPYKTNKEIYSSEEINELFEEDNLYHS